MSKRDDIARALMGVPSPWLVAPGESVMMVPLSERDAIERPAVSEGHDPNAIRGEDVMQQYFWPLPQEEEI